MAVDITALYCCLDDFCKVFADWEGNYPYDKAEFIRMSEKSHFDADQTRWSGREAGLPVQAVSAGIHAAAQYANCNGDIPRDSVAAAIEDALHAAIRYYK